MTQFLVVHTHLNFGLRTWISRRIFVLPWFLGILDQLLLASWKGKMVFACQDPNQNSNPQNEMVLILLYWWWTTKTSCQLKLIIPIEVKWIIFCKLKTVSPQPFLLIWMFIAMYTYYAKNSIRKAHSTYHVLIYGFTKK